MVKQRTRGGVEVPMEPHWKTAEEAAKASAVAALSELLEVAMIDEDQAAIAALGLLMRGEWAEAARLCEEATARIEQD